MQSLCVLEKAVREVGCVCFIMAINGTHTHTFFSSLFQCYHSHSHDLTMLLKHLALNNRAIFGICSILYCAVLFLFNMCIPS